MPNEHNHIVPVKTYLAVFVTLMVLLVITVVVAFFHFGPFNKVIALAIATTKAALIAGYFMHLRYSPRMMWVFAGLGLFGLTIMIIITISDYLARGGMITTMDAPL